MINIKVANDVFIYFAGIIKECLKREILLHNPESSVHFLSAMSNAKESGANTLAPEMTNRMRIMTAVVKPGALSQPQLYRLMQANFDSALDAVMPL